MKLKIKLTLKVEIIEKDHNPVNNYEDNYELTANEFIRQQNMSKEEFHRDSGFQIRMASGGNYDEATDDFGTDEIESQFCQNYSDVGLHFPHKIEIGIHFGLNMLTFVSWLVVIIGLVLRVECYLKFDLRIIKPNL